MVLKLVQKRRKGSSERRIEQPKRRKEQPKRRIKPLDRRKNNQATERIIEATEEQSSDGKGP
ncbi:hypothetical protein [Lysinibacillus xylanilyticus]|uniref:hypothetical protein n=1 Tax=Lysinibacillus xylanilyticus TaxID=582475 RepID=UPI0036DD517B